MPSIHLNQLDEFILDDDELDEIQLRRKQKKEKKNKPIKFIKQNFELER